MSGYRRAQISTLLARLAEDPERIVVVTGPRQTGKTTLVRQALDEIDAPFRYLAVDEPEPETLPPLDDLAADTVVVPHETGTKDTRWLARHWERARLAAARSDRGFVLAIDEIQKVPGWSETVKGLWDADRQRGVPLHAVLLGSAPLLVREGMSESLAGRYETVHVTHWSFGEMSEAFGFDLARYVYFGGYPGAARLIHEEERWRAYITDSLIEPNIERDILAMQRVDKPALLKRLFELAAQQSGQIYSFTKMLGQLQDAGNTTTLARYLDLLSSAGLIAGLPKHAMAASRRRGFSPKLNVLNTALMAALSGDTFDEARADRTFWGHMVESAIGAHLFNDGAPGCELRYWREGDLEVDFVLRCGRRLAAFEVKSGARRRRIRGIEAFRQRFGEARTVVVGEGGVPLAEFLSTPAEEWFRAP